MVFVLAGGAISTALAILTSMQTGSAENYYFVPAVFWSAATIWRLQEAGIATDSWLHRFLPIMILPAVFLQVGAIAAVISGFYGIISLRSMDERMRAVHACIVDSPRPIYASDMYLSLPWMTPGSPSFVLAFGHWQDRARGIEYERGGVGGLIDDGYFATLVLPSDRDVFDGARLDRYTITNRCAGFDIRARSR